MKILIVGGGVAGTALAGFLKNNADITLVDKAPQWGDIGYAIALWGNGRKILEKLGVEHDILKEGYEIPWNVFEDREGDVLKQFTFKIFRPYGPTVVVTRTTLHRALIKTLGEKVKLKLGTTIKEINQTPEGANVIFSNGEKDFFDLVVGADGIRSQVREMVFGKNYLKYYGWTIWAFWTPKGLQSPRGAIELASGGKMYFVYPMEDRAVVMLTTTASPETPDIGEKRREKLHELFANFKNSVSHMIDAIEDPTHIFHDNLAYIDMPKWYDGRVVLMGDAQHATSPITGMGASMALEDAFVLADELKKITSADNIPIALANYAKRRDKRVHEFRKASHLIERWMMVKSPILSLLRDMAIRVVPTNYFTKPIERLLKEII